MASAAAPQASLNRRYHFSAAHRLHVQGLSDERNRMLFGKCNNPFGHGHNYTLQVTVEGPVCLETGMVVNLAELDAFVQELILERFHLANLNADCAFAQSPSTTENLAIVLWDLLEAFAASHSPVQLRRVRVEETNNNAFDYVGRGA